jgi:selenocysteine-specific elongation factor
VRVLAAGSGLRQGSRVRVHSGTAEASARLVVIGEGGLEAGSEGWVQLRLQTPLAVRDGDRLVLRRLSPSETLAGGEVVDSAAPLHHGTDPAAVIAGLQQRADLGWRVVQELTRDRAGATVDAIAANLSEADVDVAAALMNLRLSGQVVHVGGSYWSVIRWSDLARRARLELEAFHKRSPLRPGMPSEELRGKLRLEATQATDALVQMESEGVLERRARGTVALSGWQPQLTEAQRRAVAAIRVRLEAEPLSPPRVSELGSGGEELCQYLEDQGIAVRIAPDLYLLQAAIASARDRLAAHLGATPAVTVAEARDVLGSSRKVVVPLLEYFDATHLTVRDGDTRRLRRPTTP